MNRPDWEELAQNRPKWKQLVKASLMAEETNYDRMLITGGKAGSRKLCNNLEGTLRSIVFRD
jgi:hypothetical protein